MACVSSRALGPRAPPSPHPPPAAAAWPGPCAAAELGYLPQVATATSGLLVLISATGSLFAYAAAGRLNVQYSAVVGGACLPCALVGTALISRAVRRSGRASVLVLLLTAAIATGCVATLAFQGRQAVQALASGQDIGLEPLCP